MVATVSASASIQGLPTSSTSTAFQSSLVSRTRAAARNSRSARSAAAVFFQLANAAVAASSAADTCGMLASSTTPTISFGRAGLIDAIVPAPCRRSPSMTSG